MNKQEIKDAIAKAEKQLSVAKEQDEKEFADRKLAKLMKDLSDLEAKESAKSDMKTEKSQPKAKKAPKEKKDKLPPAKFKVGDKVTSPVTKGKVAEIKQVKENHEGTSDKRSYQIVWKDEKGEELAYDTGWTALTLVKKEKSAPKASGKKPMKFQLVKEGETEQHVSKSIKIVKISDTVYDLQHKGKSTFEFQKKNGKWHVECKIKDRVRETGFNTLNGAVMYVSKHVYSAELKEYAEFKKKAAKRSEKFKEKHPTGKTTPTDDAKAGIKKATTKIKEKVKEEVKISQSINGVMSSFLSGVKEVVLSVKKAEKEDVKDIDKDTIDKLIAELQEIRKML